MMMRQPDRQRPKPAQSKENIVGAGADAEQPDVLDELRPRLRVGGDRPEHDVRVSADIFGCGLDADIDALLQRAMIERGGPGVVVQHERVALMRDLGDGRDVGHLEGLRSRRLDQHGPRVGLEMRGDAGPDQRVEIRGFDPVAGQEPVAEIAGRPIGIVADQQVIPGLEDRQERGRDRREPRRRQRHAGALRPFERLERILQRPGRRRAVAAILERAAVRAQVVGRRIEHGRAAHDRRVDEAALCNRIPPRGDKPGFDAGGG